MKLSTILFAFAIATAAHGAEIDLNSDYVSMDYPVQLTSQNGSIKEESYTIIRSKETPMKVLLTSSLAINMRVCVETKQILVGKKCKTDKYGNETCKDIYETVCAEYANITDSFDHQLRLNFKKLGPIQDSSKQTFTVVVNAVKNGPSKYHFNYTIKTPEGIKVTELFSSLFSFKKD